MERADWENRFKAILKAEVKRRDMTYDQLSAKLADIGVQDSARNIINKRLLSGFGVVGRRVRTEALGG